MNKSILPSKAYMHFPDLYISLGFILKRRKEITSPNYYPLTIFAKCSSVSITKLSALRRRLGKKLSLLSVLRHHSLRSKLTHSRSDWLSVVWLVAKRNVAFCTQDRKLGSHAYASASIRSVAANIWRNSFESQLWKLSHSVAHEK